MDIFLINLDRSTDIRVLCNNVVGEYWTETMLHEFGHAVYDRGIGSTLPWGLRTVHPVVTEGVAMMFEALVHEPRWLTTIAGLAPALVERLTPLLAAQRRAGELVTVRWVLVMTNFERQLYADPDGDHDVRWWDLVEHFQLLTRPDDRRAADWASKIHIASAPVYYHNYLLGDLVALQLRDAIDRSHGGLVDSLDAGRFLSEAIFALGASTPWPRLVSDATGHPLTVRHLVEALER